MRQPCENIDGQCGASWCDCDYQRRKRAGSFAAPPGSARRTMYDALRILMDIAQQYERFCEVMLTMPERQNELLAGTKFMDTLDNLRDELVKRDTERLPHELLGTPKPMTRMATVTDNGVTQQATGQSGACSNQPDESISAARTP